MKKEINLKTNPGIYNVVHKSGYTINTSVTIRNGSEFRHSTIDAIDKNSFIFKKLNIAEFYIEISEAQKEVEINKIDFFKSKEFLNIVNKYGLLTATHKFASELPIIDTTTESIYANFAESFPENFSGDFSEENLYEKLIYSELLAEWTVLLDPERSVGAKWSVNEFFLNKHFNRNINFIDTQKNEIRIFSTCLGGAIAVYKYSKNNPELKSCKFCSSNFVDSSKGNIQKFCSETCRAKEYRRKKLDYEKNNLTDEHGENFNFSSMKYVDIIKKEIRAECKKCRRIGLYQKEKFSELPECMYCSKK